jgi:hypothetical protein
MTALHKHKEKPKTIAASLLQPEAPGFYANCPDQNDYWRLDPLLAEDGPSPAFTGL